ncbi:hypothetical protein [Microbacterium xylanilyticum]
MLSESLRSVFPTGENLARYLTDVARGHRAGELLTDLDPLASVVVALPQFATTLHNSSRLINRVQWGGFPGTNRTVLVLSEGDAVELGWVVEDSGHAPQTGSVTVSVHGGVATLSGAMPDPAWPGEVVRILEGNCRSSLRALADDGKAALFYLVDLLGPYARSSVESASRKVFREIHRLGEDSSGGVIDREGVEQVISRLLYGRDGETSSVVTRLIVRTATTGHVIRKSTMAIMSRAIWSAAESQVRSLIGDPHQGRKIRQVAWDLKSTDPDLVLAEYRMRNPDDVARGRVIAALTAGATIAASGTLSIDYRPPERDEAW